MDDSVRAGVCTLKFQGFQVAGTAALIIKNGSYEVSILQADLE